MLRGTGFVGGSGGAEFRTCSSSGPTSSHFKPQPCFARKPGRREYP